MKPEVLPIDLVRVATGPIADRPSKVGQAEMATPWAAGGSLSAFFDRLPNTLAIIPWALLLAMCVGIPLGVVELVVHVPQGSGLLSAMFLGERGRRE